MDISHKVAKANKITAAAQ